MRELEDTLFERWRASLPDDERQSFVTDGVVDPAAYEQSPLKILFLLKEVNDPDGATGVCVNSLAKAVDGRHGTQ